MKKNFLAICLALISFLSVKSQVLVEAESFANKGGWVTDQQFMDLMGSPFLMAHGLGKPVTDASTTVNFPYKGTYHVYVRTRNWAGYWTDKDAPGKFQVLVNGKPLPPVFGTQETEWAWQYGGAVKVTKGDNTLALHDLTGFNGRCDAIYFTTDAKSIPANDLATLSIFRKKALNLPHVPADAGNFDLVVVGGGVAGVCAAISAARLGLKVALIHDRPVLGGNNSSEVRVHLGGRINLEPFPALGNLVNEIGPAKGGNAQPASYYEDQKKYDAVAGEKNIELFLNYRAFAVTKNGNKISSVTAVHIENSKELAFSAPLFADCTGDGTIGALAGADFMMGRESKNEFNEATAPNQKDKMTMGSSVQWYSEEKQEPAAFPEIKWALAFNENSAQKVKMGEWTWETGMQYDQIKDFERIRDYGLLVVLSNWSFMKNHSSVAEQYKNSALSWVAYVAGKRESRRLTGDYILKEQDITDKVIYPDGTAPTSWTIDLHYPDPKNTRHFPGNEFLSIAKHKPIYPYPVPYRCLYSRNVDNLFMAGRNISVTHVALGTIRVMRTTGMLGEVVGMAASVCIKNQVLPRGVYENHLEELKGLMIKGTGKADIPPIQHYNLGGTLLEGAPGN
ncbi:MAG: FAD-dependent oxidoreductase [Bacteroidetes bacterium]|nr:FAD-dependent oxidoreductase [Bacteroidota bacterium]